MSHDGVTVARFFRHVIAEPTSGCWLWGGMLDRYGYGNFPRTRKEAAARGQSGRCRRAHRFSWEAHRGPIPRGLCVLHHCDNRACVNPDHLFLGTDADNVHDMIAKGRDVRRGAVGVRNCNAKLTDDDVIAIRSIWRSNDISQQAIADAFGIHQTAVSEIVRRKTWRHVGMEATA